MDIFSIFTLFGGLAFFIFGMNQMSKSLEKLTGGKMETIIRKMTTNRVKGLFFGALITIAIQSSSAVTVMLVGLVNSGLMDIANTAGVIMGSNIGTTVTAWIMSLIGISSDNVFVRMFKPESFSPVVAFVGMILLMMAKSEKKRDIGNIFLGFAILMYGMMLMSGSVEPLSESPRFASILTAFNNPLLGIATGLVVTAVIQSSAASVGMLQAISMTSGLTFGMAIPIIMGQNIGTCATALLSSIGVSRNAKRVAVIHISFNIIGTIVFLILFYGINAFIPFDFINKRIDPVGIALCHTVFNVGTTLLLLPFSKHLVNLAKATIKVEEKPAVAYVDERLFATPVFALSECDRLGGEMADLSTKCVEGAIGCLYDYSEEKKNSIMAMEDDTDIYEDHLSSYLIKLAESDMSREDNQKIGAMLNIIGNLERIGDHAENVADSAVEMHEKALSFTDKAKEELAVLEAALKEILGTAIESYKNWDVELARKVEPLEEVIDILTDTLRANHIARLQSGECTIQNGFVLTDILTNYERISDHCSNIAVAVLETKEDLTEAHAYMREIKTMDNEQFREQFLEYEKKFSVDAIR